MSEELVAGGYARFRSRVGRPKNLMRVYRVYAVEDGMALVSSTRRFAEDKDGKLSRYCAWAPAVDYEPVPADEAAALVVEQNKPEFRNARSGSHKEFA